jgi:hypothetical protein
VTYRTWTSSAAGVLAWPFMVSLVPAWTLHANEVFMKMCDGCKYYQPHIVAQIIVFTYSFSPEAASTMLYRLVVRIHDWKDTMVWPSDVESDDVKMANDCGLYLSVCQVYNMCRKRDLQKCLTYSNIGYAFCNASPGSVVPCHLLLLKHMQRCDLCNFIFVIAPYAPHEYNCKTLLDKISDFVWVNLWPDVLHLRMPSLC